MAWDLPGFGLADRPPGHDYSWTGLARFCIDAVNTLNLDRFHLVVHDIGGPVGFELAAACGEIWAAGMIPPAFRFLMKLQGIGDLRHVSKAELNTYLTLMKGDDRGRAFLKVSRSAQTTASKQELYRQVVGSELYPVQVVWAVQDPAMPVRTYGRRRGPLPGCPLLTAYPASIFRKRTKRRRSPLALPPSPDVKKGTDGGLLVLPGVPSGRAAPASRVSRDKDGRLTRVTWPSVRAAAHTSWQHEHISHPQHAVGPPGRFELELELHLHHKDEVFLRGGKPVLVDRLGQLAHPDHFHAPSGKTPSRCPRTAWTGPGSPPRARH